MFFNIYYLDNHGNQSVFERRTLDETAQFVRNVLFCGGEITGIIDTEKDN